MTDTTSSLIGQIKSVIDSEVSRCADDRIGRNYKLAVMNVWNQIEPIFIRQREADHFREVKEMVPDALNDCPACNGNDASALGRIDGVGNKHPKGSYVRLVIGGREYSISEGAAEVLANELLGSIGKNVFPDTDILIRLDAAFKDIQSRSLWAHAEIASITKIELVKQPIGIISPEEIMEKTRIVHDWFIKECPALPDSGDLVDSNAYPAFHALCRVMAYIFSLKEEHYA